MNVPGWKAILSNSEIFEGGDIGAWRVLKNKCDAENLTIKKLLRDDKEVDPHPATVSYFIMYDQVTTLISKQSRTRICFGSFRKNGKARLQWEVINNTLGSEDRGNHTRIVSGDNEMWKELAISVQR